MQYLVSAQPRIDVISKFWGILNDGTVESQEPDGQEIVASMKRAVFKGGRAAWSETCYCNPPLRHERSTVYDLFFTDMEITPSAQPTRLEGQRFWDYLRDSSKRAGETLTTRRMRYAPIRVI